MLKAEIDRFEKSLIPKTRDELMSITVDIYIQYVELASRMKEEEKSNHEMFEMFNRMKNELEDVRKELGELREQNRHLTGITTLQTQKMFGRSSEKASSLFADGPAQTTDDPLSEEAEETDAFKVSRQSEPVHFKTEKQRRRSHERQMSREEYLSKLPQRKVYEYDIEDLNKKYGAGNWTFALWEAHDTIERIKACTYRKTVFTPVIRVKNTYSPVRIPYEGRIIDKSLVSASLLSEILCDFGSMGLPMYRMEHDTDRYGFPISRQTMSNWVMTAGNELLAPVADRLKELLKDFIYQQADETTYRVISEKEHSKNYVWIHRTSELSDTHPIIIYCFEPSRAADHLYRFFGERDKLLILSSDAYGAYTSLEQKIPEYISVCGCMAHCRRRWVDSMRVSGNRFDKESRKALPEFKAIELLERIYHAEGMLRELTPEERQKRRQTDVKPLTEEFFEYVHSLDASDPACKEKLKDAISYTKNQEEKLCGFLKDGNIPIDNSASERNVKIIAVHRKNSLFSYSEKGASATMNIISLIETAKENKAVPYYYLKYLLERMSKAVIYGHDYDIGEMLPWSKAYREYEQEQRMNIFEIGAPPGNEKPQTPLPETESMKKAV